MTLFLYIHYALLNNLHVLCFQGARGLPGERGRIGAPGSVVSYFLPVQQGVYFLCMCNYFILYLELKFYIYFL